MPYICVHANRYVGEHSCSHYHYGDMSVRRQCCIDDAVAARELAQRVAMTDQHPAYRLWLDAYNGLTDVERLEVGDFSLAGLR